ncbi:MAG: alpha/beta hydrolase [Chloroflexi bacterium]|nr:alpha/beta hydrolase [Chloroflexota bacterium]
MKCDLGNITAYYETYGEGKPIIFLHGWNIKGDHRQWSEITEPFFQNKNGWQRIYVDLPGMGKTPGADWISNSEDVVNILLKFIDKLLPDQKVLLAGFSYGGYIAQGIVYQKPEIVDGLCLLAPVTRDPSQRTLPEHVVLQEDKELLAELIPEEAQVFQMIFVVQTRKILDATKAFNAREPGDQKFLDRLYENYIFSYDVEKLPHPFDKPSLIVTGRQDAITGYQSPWNILHNYPRASFIVLDKAGHILMWEQEELFLNLFSEWLDRVAEQIEA